MEEPSGKYPYPEPTTLEDIESQLDRIEVMLMDAKDQRDAHFGLLWTIIGLAGFIIWKLFNPS